MDSSIEQNLKIAQVNHCDYLKFLRQLIQYVDTDLLKELLANETKNKASLIQKVKIPQNLYSDYGLDQDQYFDLLCQLIRQKELILLLDLVHFCDLPKLDIPGQRHQLLKLAITKGDPDILELLYDQYQLTADDARQIDALGQAAIYGRMHLFELFRDVYGLTTEDTQMGHSLVLQHLSGRFWGGTFRDARYLRLLGQVFDLTIEDFDRADLLGIAARLGGVKVLKYLKDVYESHGSSFDETRKTHLLLQAAEYGKVESFQALHEIFGLGGQDFRQSKALDKIIAKGHHQVLEVLQDLYDLTFKELREAQALTEAIGFGYDQLVEEICARFDLEASDLLDDDLLNLAAVYGYPEILETFYYCGLTVEDLFDSQALVRVISDGNVEAFQVFRQIYGLKPSHIDHRYIGKFSSALESSRQDPKMTKVLDQFWHEHVCSQNS